jgi:hypothetical protein
MSRHKLNIKLTLPYLILTATYRAQYNTSLFCGYAYVLSYAAGDTVSAKVAFSPTITALQRKVGKTKRTQVWGFADAHCQQHGS